MDQWHRLVEIEKIKNLRSLFSHHFDSRDLDSLVGLFASDAVCEFPEEFGGNWRGQAEIRTRFRSYLDSYHRDWSTIHAITNHVVTLEGHDRAVGTCYLLDYLVEQQESPLYAIAVFDDVYVRLDHQWLIQRMRIQFHWRAGSPQ